MKHRRIINTVSPVYFSSLINIVDGNQYFIWLMVNPECFVTQENSVQWAFEFRIFKRFYECQ